MYRREPHDQGFTLIELLIVIAIIGILAASLLPNLFEARSTAVRGAMQTHSRNMLTVVTAWLASSHERTTATAATTWSPCVDAQTHDGYSAPKAPAEATTCSVDGSAGAVIVTVSGTVAGELVTYNNGIRQ